jgi:predicted AAA+ superfamily ATPase
MRMAVEYRRPMFDTLRKRIAEPRRFIQVVAGARQVGKTTLVRQVVQQSDLAVQYASADEPGLKGREWLVAQWDAARLRAGRKAALLVVDEIQKIDGWDETVKRLWDEDSHAKRKIKVVLLGSAPLLAQRGLTESLAGRFEVIHLPHWSAAEMMDAFGWNVEQYIFHGGYPGAAALIGEHERWAGYVRDALIETSISRDILLLTRVDKPALLRRLFEIGCQYSGQILSFTKLLGQLQDAGNTTTLAHYLELLGASGLLAGLQKYAGETVRQRASSPKFLVYNTALISALSGYSLQEARETPQWWGRLVESAIGAHLLNAAAMGLCDLFYWRDGQHEVDFLVRYKRRLIAIEVKSGRSREVRSGLDRFATAFRPHRILLVGGDGIPVEEFLLRPVEHWLG